VRVTVRDIGWRFVEPTIVVDERISNRLKELEFGPLFGIWERMHAANGQQSLFYRGEERSLEMSGPERLSREVACADGDVLDQSIQRGPNGQDEAASRKLGQ